MKEIYRNLSPEEREEKAKKKAMKLLAQVAPEHMIKSQLVADFGISPQKASSIVSEALGGIQQGSVRNSVLYSYSRLLMQLDKLIAKAQKEQDTHGELELLKEKNRILANISKLDVAEAPEETEVSKESVLANIRKMFPSS